MTNEKLKYNLSHFHIRFHTTQAPPTVQKESQKNKAVS